MRNCLLVIINYTLLVVNWLLLKECFMNLAGMLVLMASSWIPRRTEDFVAFCTVWRTGLSDLAQGTAFGWVRETTMTLVSSIDGFLEAWEAYLEDNSSFNRRRKDMLREEAVRGIEDFANTSIRFNRKMTEPDKNRYGVFSRKPPHPVPVPVSVPVLEARAGNPREVVVAYKDRDLAKRGKPKGVHGIEVCWMILGHAPLSVAELVNSSFDTRSPFRLVFDEADRGKRLYLVGRWEIGREGEKGEYGEIVSVIIP
jgi:hypothetical protein